MKERAWRLTLGMGLRGRDCEGAVCFASLSAVRLPKMGKED